MPHQSPRVSADAVEALLVLVVHAADVGRDVADVVGDEEEKRLRVGRAEVGVDGGELSFFEPRP